MSEPDDIVTRLRNQIEDGVYPAMVPLLRDAIELIGEMSAALAPFANKAKGYDWRRNQTFKWTNRDGVTKEYPDDMARVLLDALVAVPTTKGLCLGDFRKAREVWMKANGMNP